MGPPLRQWHGRGGLAARTAAHGGSSPLGKTPLNAHGRGQGVHQTVQGLVERWAFQSPWRRSSPPLITIRLCACRSGTPTAVGGPRAFGVGPARDHRSRKPTAVLADDAPASPEKDRIIHARAYIPLRTSMSPLPSCGTRSRHWRNPVSSRRLTRTSSMTAIWYVESHPTTEPRCSILTLSPAG